MNNLKYHFLVLLATVLVAGSFIVSEKLTHIANPLSLSLLRFVCSVIVMSPFVLGKKKLRRKIIGTMPRALLISFFYSAYFIALFEALKITGSLNIATLFTAVPLVTGLLSMIFFKQKLSLKKAVVYVIGMAGTTWVIFRGNIERFKTFSLNQGDAIFLIAVVFMALYIISMKYLYRDDNHFLLVYCALLGGVFWMSLALLLTGKTLEWNLIQGESVYYMVYLVIGATLISGYLFLVTSVNLSPDKMSAYIYLNPVFVAAMLALFGLEKIAPIVLPGIAFSVLATVLLQKGKR